MGRCIFCDISAKTEPSHQIYEDEQFLAFLDIYPVRPGHTLVIPRQHGQFLADFDDATCGKLFRLGRRLGAAIRASSLPCDDINYVLNDGPSANQTVPHAHLHLVPRTRRDLPKLARMLLQRPLQPLLPRVSDPTLAEQAAAIAAALPPD